MSFYRLFGIVRKELYHILRDVRTLFLVTIAPAFLLFTLAYVFSMDAEHFNLIVLDQDRTSLSRQYVADLTSDGTFRTLAYVEDYKEIDSWLQTGRAHLALVIPPGAAATLQARRSAQVQAIVDGVDAIAAGQIINQLNARTNAFALQLLSSINGRLPDTVDVRDRVWYNPPLKSLNSMIPGLIALVLVLPALAFSVSLTREKEMGSLEGLVATPIRGGEYLLGKMLTYTGFGLIGTLSAALIATVWFRVPFQGNLLTFLALAACYFLATLGISMLVAHFVKTQQAAMLIVILVLFVPSFFITGLILPIDTSSAEMTLAAYSLPATHFILICRGVFLKGLGMIELLSPALALLVTGIVSLVSSLALFRKWMD